MQISENWLKTFINKKINFKKIKSILNKSGIEINKEKNYFSKIKKGIINRCFKINNKKIYYIYKINKFSNYIKYYLKKNNIIFFFCKKKKIILCTKNNLRISDNKKILVLKKKNKNILNYYDNTINVKLPSNRFDCSSILGLANEISILTNTKIKKKYKKNIINLYKFKKVKILQKNIKFIYISRIIKNINVNIKTPLWIIRRLKYSYIKCSKNILKNISNYVMLEFGQYNNIFDLNKINGNLNIRKSNYKEKINLSKHNNIELKKNSIIISDNNKVISLVGIISNYKTLFSKKTKNIYIESSKWYSNNISYIKKYNIINKNLYYSNKNINYLNLINNIEFITKLIIKLCGNKNTQICPIYNKKNNFKKKKIIKLNIKNIYKILGFKINLKKIIRIFKKLKIKFIKNHLNFYVISPEYRKDLNIEVDFIEEIAKIYGFNKIPLNFPIIKINSFKKNINQDNLLLNIYKTINDLGYHEVINYSFIDKYWENIIKNKKKINIINPISKKLNVLRSSLIPGLILNTNYNIKFKENHIRIFEIGNIFIYNIKKNIYQQKKNIACLNYGTLFEDSWNNTRNINFFDVKGDLESLFYPLKLKFKKLKHKYLNSEISAKIILNNKPIGIIGELNILLQKKFKFKYPPILFEIKFSSIKKNKFSKILKISKFPLIIRDISLIIPNILNIQDLLKFFKIKIKIKNIFIKKIVVINEYINKDKKNITLRIFFEIFKKIKKKKINILINNIIKKISNDTIFNYGY